MATLCASCGFNNPPGMRFCGNCGTRLADAPSPQPEQKTTLDAAASNLGVMMGADLADRFRQAGLAATGQRRNVTVLFADLSGYTALSGRIDSEDLYELVQQYVRLLSHNVYKYEGIVDKLTGDGVMALFGAPISHENNAERAVRAALDMQTDLMQLNRQLRSQIGMASDHRPLSIAIEAASTSKPRLLGKSAKPSSSAVWLRSQAWTRRALRAVSISCLSLSSVCLNPFAFRREFQKRSLIAKHPKINYIFGGRRRTFIKFVLSESS